jgi:hypothetical protein
MSTPKPELALPTIHLNGNSADSLIDEWQSAYSAIGEAQRALQETAPNMRNFYVQKDGEANFKKARDEHFARIQKLEDVRQELVALCEGVDEQLREREALRGRP